MLITTRHAVFKPLQKHGKEQQIPVHAYVLYLLLVRYFCFSVRLVLLDLIVLRVYIIIDNIKNSNTWPVYSKHLYFVRSGRNNLRHDIVVTRLSSNLEYAKL